MTKTHPAGFTLVELITVIAVGCVLIGITASNLLASLPAMHLGEAARGLVLTIQNARSRAIQGGTPVSVSLAGDRGYLVAQNGATLTRQELHGDPGVVFGSADQPASYPTGSCGTFTDCRIEFFPNGGATPGIIYVKTSQESPAGLRITISPLGRPQIQRLLGSGYQ